MNDSDNQQERVEEMLRRTMGQEVPAEVRERLHAQFAAFRARLEERAASPRGLTGIPRGILRAASAAAVAMVVLGVVLALFAGNTKPTWAEVRDRFDSVPHVNATIYMKAHAGAEPVQLEIWMEQGGLLRLRAGSRVMFGERGRPMQSVSFAPEHESAARLKQARDMVEQIVRTLGDAPAFSFDALVAALDFGGSFSAPLENPNASVSNDLIVFDIAKDDSPDWIRVWALRESRLPTRLLFWDPKTTQSLDVVLDYAGKQSPEFFDPEAFRKSLADTGGEGPSQAYRLFRDPGGRPVTPEDVAEWRERQESAPAPTPGTPGKSSSRRAEST